MLKLAAASLVSLLILLTGCLEANADVSTSSRRACTITAAPTPIASITAVADPVVIDQIAPTPIVVTLITNAISNPTKVIAKKKVKAKIPESGLYEVSGYTSTPGQTDATPCIAADTSDICRRKAAGELICASNAFPLGTKIHVAGLGTCVVADHMNSRYQRNVDWYFGQDATPPKGHEKDLKYLPKLRRAMKIDRNGPPRLVTIISTPKSR